MRETSLPSASALPLPPEERERSLRMGRRYFYCLFFFFSEVQLTFLKELNPEYPLEELMLKLKLQFFGHLMRRANSLKKTLMLGGIEGKRRRGWQRMRWLDSITIQLEQLKSTNSSSIELEQILGNSEGQGSLTRCSALGLKESDTIQQLNRPVDLQCCFSFRISGVQHSKIVFLQIILHYNL